MPESAHAGAGAEVAEPDQNGACRFCGLPTPSRRRDRFCCFGCEIAFDVSGDREGDVDDRRATWLLARVLFAAMLSMGVMAFSIALWADGRATAAGVDPGPFDTLLRWGAAAFATPALGLLLGPLIVSVWGAVRAGEFPSSQTVLVTLGSAAAYGLSLSHTLIGTGEVYYETAVMLPLLITVGHWLEARAKARAGTSLRDLANLLPATAHRVMAGGAVDEDIPAADLRVGDRVRILVGERSPVDGRVLLGRARMDRSLISGESDPIPVEPGDVVVAGTACTDGSIVVGVDRPIGERYLDRLARFVADARGRRPRIALLAERVSRVFLPLVLLIGAATWVVWSRAGDPVDGLFAALAVVLVACPCALGIAAPLAVTTTIARAASRGVVVRGGEVIEWLSRPGVVFFDKTGTLTRPHAAEAVGSEPEVLADLARHSSHPLARALAHRAAGGRVSRAAAAPDRVTLHAGRGIEVEAEGATYLLGSARFLGERGIDTGAVSADDSGGVPSDVPELFASRDGRFVGAVRFADSVRPDALSVVRGLEARGWRVVVLTGDHLDSGARLSEKLGVEVRAGLLPEDKVRAVHEVDSATTTVMIGDGWNDAAVVASARVGVSLSEGVEITRDAADVVLVDAGDGRLLEPFLDLVDLARDAMRRIRWNLAWAFGYNLAGVALAAFGVVHPAIAAGLMVASSTSVVLTSVGRAPWRAPATGEASAVRSRSAAAAPIGAGSST